MSATVDPRRADKIKYYKPPENPAINDDLMPDYMNILGKLN